MNKTSIYILVLLLLPISTLAITPQWCDQTDALEQQNCTITGLGKIRLTEQGTITYTNNTIDGIIDITYNVTYPYITNYTWAIDYRPIAHGDVYTDNLTLTPTQPIELRIHVLNNTNQSITLYQKISGVYNTLKTINIGWHATLVPTTETTGCNDGSNIGNPMKGCSWGNSYGWFSTPSASQDAILGDESLQYYVAPPQLALTFSTNTNVTVQTIEEGSTQYTNTISLALYNKSQGKVIVIFSNNYQQYQFYNTNETITDTILIETPTNQQVIQVWDGTNYVKDAKVTIQAIDPTTNTYKTTNQLYTAENGQVIANLVNPKIYRIYAAKTGYNTNVNIYTIQSPNNVITIQITPTASQTPYFTTLLDYLYSNTTNTVSGTITIIPSRPIGEYGIRVTYNNATTTNYCQISQMYCAISYINSTVTPFYEIITGAGTVISSMYANYTYTNNITVNVKPETGWVDYGINKGDITIVNAKYYALTIYLLTFLIVILITAITQVRSKDSTIPTLTIGFFIASLLPLITITNISSISLFAMTWAFILPAGYGAITLIYKSITKQINSSNG